VHPLVEFLLTRLAEDRAALQLLDQRFRTTWVAECDARRRIVEMIGLGLAEADSLAGCDVLLLLARPYSEHPDFRPDWRL
jgi:hypothetical protein